MATADYDKAREAALALLEKYNIKSPVVPVFDIAQEEGLSIKSFDMPDELHDVAGFFDPATKIIYVNQAETANRQTFTVAHELGHYILNHPADQVGVLPRWPKMQTGTNNAPEQEANCFAEELLVPSHFLKEQMEKYDVSPENSEILAQLFGVSRSVMDIKLRHTWLRAI